MADGKHIQLHFSKKKKNLDFPCIMAKEHDPASSRTPNNDASCEATSRVTTSSLLPSKAVVLIVQYLADEEVDIYHFELLFPEKGRKATLPLWEVFLHRDSQRMKQLQRWRPIEETMKDVKFCNQEKKLGCVSLASLRGRDYARHVSFTRERAKEAREIIYDFDGRSIKHCDVDNTRKVKTSKHWQQWDLRALSRALHYRRKSATSNNCDCSVQVHLFVQLTLCDSTGRSWAGFRRTKLIHSTTTGQLKFNLDWKLDELIEDRKMNWWEAREYCSRYLPDYYRSQRAREELSKLMTPIQLTLSLNDGLILATGGCAGDVYCLSPCASFQFRHSRYPQDYPSVSTGIDEAGGSTYQATMCLVGESPSFRKTSPGMTCPQFQRDDCCRGSQDVRRNRRRALTSESLTGKERSLSITIRRESSTRR
mmetsp:Transcript_31440/g.52489  ORF Transcript_31440/g.52489 Transcript_31440/m.52489 type:complete len:423 (+) Transcript_31440:199-1467(+)